MHDVAVTLDEHQILHLHAAEIAHAPDVVARKVNKHDVLGAFLRIGEQFFFERQIFLGIFSATARSGNRADFHFAFFAADMNFRRCTDERRPRGLAKLPQECHRRGRSGCYTNR